MNAEEKQALIEVATKRLNQSRKMAEAQKGSVRPRGGIEIDYGINIALMEIALAALTAKPIGYIDPATLKEYRGKRAGGSWSAEPKSGEYNQTLPIFTTPPVSALEQPHHNGMMMLAQKLAAAEAKLVELAKQPPIAWTDEQELRDVNEHGCGYIFTANPITPNADERRVIKLFDRAAPAADLAELVPEKWTLEQALKFVEGHTPPSEEEAVMFAVNSFRATILRNIEGAHQNRQQNIPEIILGWKLVPVEPTERMVIDGFESAPSPIFSEPEEWAKYESMSGCQQAAYKARLCWAAMLAAAPKVGE